MYHAYIIRLSDGSLYTGYTTDVERRVAEHNAGTASRITRSKRPVVLVHQESFRTKSRAMQREAEIKSWPRSRKVALIQKKSTRTTR